jgi:hypothetical protein
MGDIIKINETNIASVLKAIGTEGLQKPFSQNIYLVDVQIAGTAYIEDIEKIEPLLTERTRLQFFRENNPYDPMAIVIKDSNGNKLGYIPRAQNEILSRLMDAGKLLYGNIVSKEFVKKWLKITIQVYLCD